MHVGYRRWASVLTCPPTQFLLFWMLSTPSRPWPSCHRKARTGKSTMCSSSHSLTEQTESWLLKESHLIWTQFWASKRKPVSWRKSTLRKVGHWNVCWRSHPRKYSPTWTLSWRAPTATTQAQSATCWPDIWNLTLKTGLINVISATVGSKLLHPWRTMWTRTQAQGLTSAKSVMPRSPHRASWCAMSDTATLLRNLTSARSVTTPAWNSASWSAIYDHIQVGCVSHSLL